MIGRSNSSNANKFYQQAIRSVENAFQPPDELCFVYVQHAFTPLIEHLDAVDHRFAGLIPKHSSASSNPQVLRQLEARFPGKIFSGITRHQLRNSEFTFHLLERITQGRPFVILEYGAYFAPVAAALCEHPVLGKQVAGFVEGTENGIAGSGDQKTLGYRDVAPLVAKPILSKSRSGIKSIMDLQIGPAIVAATRRLLQGTYLNRSREQLTGEIGVIGLGAIGQGVLRELDSLGCQPLVHDQNAIVMATLAHEGCRVSSLQTILARSDILFLNTGSCFLSENPELLNFIKDGCLLVLCTSGDVEAGIPQLIHAQHLIVEQSEKSDAIATYISSAGKRVRVLLGNDGVGQAPNMTTEDGSGSAANMMSDMEFYALGALLGSSQHNIQPGEICPSPSSVQQMIAADWLECLYPESLGKTDRSSIRTGELPAKLAAEPSGQQNQERQGYSYV